MGRVYIQEYRPEYTALQEPNEASYTQAAELLYFTGSRSHAARRWLRNKYSGQLRTACGRRRRLLHGRGRHERELVEILRLLLRQLLLRQPWLQLLQLQLQLQLQW